MTVLTIHLDKLSPEAREALRGVLSGALHQLDALDVPEPAPAPEPAPTFLDVDGYAKRIHVSAWKVRQLCQLGLPHSRLPGGRKLIRIDVAQADAWMKAQGSKL